MDPNYILGPLVIIVTFYVTFSAKSYNNASLQTELWIQINFMIQN